MDKNTSLNKIIKKYDNIVIAKHMNADWDAYGSAYGLKEIIKDNFKNKNVYIGGQQVGNVIESEDIRDLKNFLLITVDLANIKRIDFPNYKDATEIFKVDHHPEDDNFAGVNKLVDSSAIACTQVITIWAKQENLVISKNAAYYLYKGLVTDSGRFLFRNVNAQTFEAAKILLDTGVKITDIYDELYLQDLELVKFRQKMFGKAKYFANKQVAYIILKERKIKYINEEDAKNCLSTLASIKEIKIWFIVFVKKNKKIKVSIRSRDYNINQIAIKWNGGGHILASGFEIDKISDIKKILVELNKILQGKE